VLDFEKENINKKETEKEEKDKVIIRELMCCGPARPSRWSL
jgi:hypothetical protein